MNPVLSTEGILMGGDGSKWQGDPTKIKHEQLYKFFLDLWPGKEPFMLWKLTEGQGDDPTGLLNVLKSHEAGFKMVGGYHFYATPDTWKPQAERYLKQWDKVGLEVYPEIDLENTSYYRPPRNIPLYQNNILEWLRFVAARTGVDPVIYSNRSWILSYLQNIEFRKYPLHIANWNVAYPLVPLPWPSGLWSVWQTGVFSAAGTGLESRTFDVNLAQNLPRMS